jgi:hypothetical protein
MTSASEVAVMREAVERRFAAKKDRPFHLVTERRIGGTNLGNNLPAERDRLA